MSQRPVDFAGANAGLGAALYEMLSGQLGH